MKFGMRKPSLKRSFKAKTTGRAKRALKSSINPLYGKKGMGLVNNPKKAVYNKVYNKTTVSAIPKGSKSKSKSKNDTDSEFTVTGCLLTAIWAGGFSKILFNGKPLLSKFISFLAVVFLSTLVVSFIDNKINSTESSEIDDPDYDRNVEEANSYLKQINESIRIINSTKNPETFFSRHDFILERLPQLIDILSKVSYSGDNPIENLAEFEENKTSSFNEFIDRYYEEVLLKINNLKTEKAKINNANNFFENLMQYEGQLETENIDYINKLYVKLKENINK